ncbi:thioredoxin [Lewinellaceae bacterium SD302]|nr:thioredoxin [Lewinellaceae bacterium SD302]
MKTLNLLIALSLLLLFGCSEPKTDGITTILQPNTDQGLSFPVYDNFDAIEGLFNQQNDTTYVINFWATWCAPCVEELPHFQQLARDYTGKPLRIVLVSLDFKKDLTTKLPRFIEEFPLDPRSLPVVALTDKDQNSWIDRVDSRWTGTIPITVIYKNGLRFFVDKSFSTYQDLKTQVEPLM